MSAASADKPYPRADAWEGLARAMSILPGRCVALATSGDACKAALAAGMRCVAVPDRFTAFHDFSGADLVADRGLDDASARRILDLLEAR
jgi:beta-phosphoglucomutase-like phosphatase (HAD superfamily)